MINSNDFLLNKANISQIIIKRKNNIWDQLSYLPNDGTREIILLNTVIQQTNGHTDQIKILQAFIHKLKKAPQWLKAKSKLKTNGFDIDAINQIKNMRKHGIFHSIPKSYEDAIMITKKEML